jgi:glutathione gamma-glutamylcysteinyltransferase
VEELACLARCNGADVELHRADATNLDALRTALGLAARGEAVLVASYDRSAMGQTGSGHFSPVGGHHAARDLALILDVARFKYPPHWVSVERLWRAMQPVDPATRRARGWMVLRPRQQGIALGFSVRCEGESWQGLARRLNAVVEELTSATELASLARALVPLVAHVELRMPSAAAHREALASARAALRELPVHQHVSEAIGTDHAEAVTLLLLAIEDILTEHQRAALGRLASTETRHAALAGELSNVRAQLAALWTHARQSESATASTSS